jgi:hypothetical protein
MPDDVETRTSDSPAGRRSAGRPRDQRSERELLGEISTKLDKVIAVLAVQGKDKDQQIEALAGAGFDSAFIGRLVGMTPGAVRMWFTRRRRTTSDASANVHAVPEGQRESEG